MPTPAELENSLLKEFNDYDQTVDVVSAWQSLSKFVMPESVFYRFGKFKDANGTELTPDFVVAVPKAGKALPGALVCDIKKVPNPYPSGVSGDAATRAYEVFSSRVEEIYKYTSSLQYSSQQWGLPLIQITEHDVVFITPSKVCDAVYAFLKQTLGTPFVVSKRPIVLVEYFYDQSDQFESYVFKWKQGEANSPFTHAGLRDRMVTKSQPATVYPIRFIEHKIRHVLCNDPPPPIYVMMFLWVEVFIKFLGEDQFEVWKQASTSKIVDLELTAAQILDKLREDYLAPFVIHDIRRALDAFVEIGRAAKKEGKSDSYLIHYSNLAGRVFEETPDAQKGVAKRTEYREYGQLFAALLARKELRVKPEPTQRSRSRKFRIPRDYPKLPGFE